MYISMCGLYCYLNSPHPGGGSPTWGDGVQATDWKGAVERATPVVLTANPDLLILVDGLQYSTDFTGGEGSFRKRICVVGWLYS